MLSGSCTILSYGVLGQQVALQRGMECIRARLGSQWRLWRCLRSMPRRGWLWRQTTSIVTTRKASNSCRCSKLELVLPQQEGPTGCLQLIPCS